MSHKISLKYLKTTSIIGVIAGTSLICTQFIIGNELKEVNKVPTTYNISQLAHYVNRQIPKGYPNPNYKAIYSANRPNYIPDSKELSYQEAAEIAAQEIFRFFGENLKEQTFALSYYKDGAYSKWLCNVEITPSYWSHVELNANTGEILYIERAGAPIAPKLENEKLTPSVSEFERNREDYLIKAKDFILQKGFISEPIQSISYVSNSYDAFAIGSHTFEITTTSHKIYQFSLSENLTSLRDFKVVIQK